MPLLNSVYGFISSASLAPAIAARASAYVRSNVATSSAVLAGGGVPGIGLPPGAVSSSSWLTVSVPLVPRPGRSESLLARIIRGGLDSGTRGAWRVA